MFGLWYDGVFAELMKTITIEEHESIFLFVFLSFSVISRFFLLDVAELLLCQEMFCAVSQSEY
jgi:hypothetical protein